MKAYTHDPWLHIDKIADYITPLLKDLINQYNTLFNGQIPLSNESIRIIDGYIRSENYGYDYVVRFAVSLDIDKDNFVTLDISDLFTNAVNEKIFKSNIDLYKYLVKNNFKKSLDDAITKYLSIKNNRAMMLLELKTFDLQEKTFTFYELVCYYFILHDLTILV
jgi:hypothetical protein